LTADSLDIFHLFIAYPKSSKYTMTYRVETSILS
jgi:hypothetical protein